MKKRALSVDFTHRFIDPLFKDLRTAALAGDLAGVRQSLDAIQKRQSLSDFEMEGHLLYASAYLLMEQNEFALAEEIIQTLLRYNPEVASVYVGLGDILSKMGNAAASVENYQRAIALEDRFGRAAVPIDESESKRTQYLKEE